MGRGLLGIHTSDWSPMLSIQTRRQKYIIAGLVLIILGLTTKLHYSQFFGFKVGRRKPLSKEITQQGQLDNEDVQDINTQNKKFAARGLDGYFNNSHDVHQEFKGTRMRDFYQTLNSIGDVKRKLKSIVWYDLQQVWVSKWAGGRWNEKMFENCPVKECTISRSKSKFLKSDAVIFDGFTLSTVAMTQKPRDQIWILYLNDSPMIYRFTDRYRSCNGKFNWTLSYRRDSDFYFNMGRLTPLQRKRSFDFDEMIKSKKKLATVVSSNCRTSSKRQEYINELQKRISVDVYGKCGSLKCDDNFLRQRLDAWSFSNSSKEHEKCFHNLETTYKFYLSFENSFCKDYITEKGLHRILERDIIPIVRGGTNYSLYHPPYSSINVDDFKNIKHLGNFLLYLNKNEKEYIKYLRWKELYGTENMGGIFQETMCELCKRLHEPNLYRRLYADIHSWVFKPNNRSVCWKP